MLHAVPELLDALEAKLVQGGDPSELLSRIRWTDLVGWPEDLEGAKALKRRVLSLQALLQGLQAPLRATLVGLSQAPAYSRQGIRPDLPGHPCRLREEV